VPIKAGIPVLTIITPFKAPPSAPKIRLSNTVIPTGILAFNKRPVVTARKPKSEPIDRSRPPDINTIVAPVERVPRTTAWVRIVFKVLKDLKVDEDMQKAM